MPYTAREIAALVKGEVAGDPETVLRGFSPADRAQPGDLTFAENEMYFGRADQSAATAIIVDGPYSSTRKVLIRVLSARIAFAKVLPLFFPEPAFQPGVHSTAVVSPSARVDPTAYVGPHCVVGDHAFVGPKVVLESLVHVSADCQVGEATHLYPRVTLYPRCQIGQRVRVHSGAVIGSDGFGYVFDEGMHRKVPQIGYVVIHDDVEIGANVTIDRGALGPTIIGRGSKIDNLVQIGHNVVMGEHCLVIAQVGIAGSTRLGNHVTLAGQTGIAGHLKIGHRVTIAAKSGVMNDIPDGEKWMGAPARPSQQMKRQFIAMQQLPDLLRRVAELEKRLFGTADQGLPGPNESQPTTPVRG